MGKAFALVINSSTTLLQANQYRVLSGPSVHPVGGSKTSDLATTERSKNNILRAVVKPLLPIRLDIDTVRWRRCLRLV